MALFDFLFKNRPKPRGEYHGVFKLLNGYEPHFTSFGGCIYEEQLVRASIDAIARNVSKLRVTVSGSAKPALQNKLKHAPNEFQTWSQFEYRLSTILDVHNTAFITPIWDQFGQPSGIYAPLPQRCEIVQYAGVPYLRYEFSNGDRASCRMGNAQEP